MSNTYSQLYMHIVFAVQGRANRIEPHWKEELHRYITGIVTQKEQKLMCINSMPDHVHMLIGFKPECHIADLVRDIKSNSSRWVNAQRFTTETFRWQKGYGVFSVGYSSLDTLINYILNQEEHHRVKNLREEYIELLAENQIDYDQKYLFKSY